MPPTLDTAPTACLPAMGAAGTGAPAVAAATAATAATALLLLLSSCAPPASVSAEATAPVSAAAAIPPPTQRRAILVSFDSFSEQRLAASIPGDSVPALRALFTQGACAAWARPAFPSVTAPGHAAIWTGAYGDVSGIAANSQPRLPADRYRLLESISGYSAAALRAEPIWITAGRAGRRVVANHPTQAPQPPGYPAAHSGVPEPRIGEAVRGAGRVLGEPHVLVLNGYNRRIGDDRLVSDSVAPPRPARGWTGLDASHGRLPPLEIAWSAGAAMDSLHALILGDARYDRVLVAPSRDAARGVLVRQAGVERAPVRGRALARHFSAALAIAAPPAAPAEGDAGEAAGTARADTAFGFFRLLDLSPDGASFRLLHPGIHVVEMNRPEIAGSWNTHVRGWIGNGTGFLLRDGVLGRNLQSGGDGTAELIYLETLELLARQSMRGAAWAWEIERAELMLDYDPTLDEVDHAWYGYIEPSVPAHDPALAARIQEMRVRAWMLSDRRLAHLRSLAAEDPGALLVVSGDHGMRATWRTFRPNAALREAGLLALDERERIDLARSRALSSNGYWVSVNGAGRAGGVVPDVDRGAVLAEAEAALLAARTPEGTPIVTRVWRAAEDDSLGLGGPAGGDLYYETAAGYRLSSDARGAVSTDGDPGAGHGYPSVAPDMRTVLCAWGAAFPARRSSPARTIDAAPTVAEWLGIPAPADSRGRSRLTELRGARAGANPSDAASRGSQ